MANLLQDLIDAALDAARNDRKITAGLVLARLRRIYEDSAPATFPIGQQTWQGFVDKHLWEIGLDRVQALIGHVVHRGGIMHCTKCKAEAVCRCGCGVAYMPQNQWAADSCNENQPASARTRGRPRINDHPMTSTERSRRRRGKVPPSP